MSASVSNIEVLLHKLISKSLSAKQTVDSNTNAVGGVNEKGELMVGNGTGPDHITTNGATNGDVLTKDDTQDVGVKWVPPPSQGSNNGLLYLTSSTVLLANQHNNMVVCNGVFTVVLPDTTTLPVGTRFTFVNSCDNPADVTTVTTSNGTTFLVDNLGASTNNVLVDVNNKAFVYYIGNNVWRVHGIHAL
jgi:hypothetical protein